MKLARENEQALALEIDDLAVRLARFVRTRKKTLVLSTWNTVSLPPGAMLNGSVQKPEVVRTAIAQAIQTAKGRRLNPRFVSVIVPEPHVFTTLVPIQGNQTPTREQVETEASQHLPFPLDEVQLDYQILESTPQFHRVLVGAVPNETVSELTKLIESCRLVPIILEPESAAVVRAVTEPGEPDRTQLILDLGQSITSVLVARQDVVQFSSSSKSFSGANLTATVADRLHLTLTQAEKAKRLFGLFPKEGKGEVRKALLPLTNELLARLHEIENFATTHLPIPTKSIAAIKLTGGGSALPGLGELLGSELRIPISSALPSDVYHWDAHSANLPDDVQRSMTAVLGAALRLLL
jgi:type IV pilus assembly protein PilM